MMKSILLGLAALIATFTVTAQTVGIGTVSPSSNAVLDIVSATKAMIVPRLSGSAIAALTGEEGMIVYNTDNKTFMGYTAASQALIVGQQNGSYSQSIVSTQRVGQSFIAPTTCALQYINVLLFGSQPASYITGASMTLYLGAGLTGPMLATVNATSINANTAASFNFGNVTLRAGQIYTFELKAPTNGINLKIDYNNGYLEGTMYSGTAGNNIIQQGVDLAFEVGGVKTAGWKPLQ